MSEEQLRREFQESRIENREDHKSILEVIEKTKDDTIKAVEKQMQANQVANEKILKSYKTIVRLAAGVMVTFFGWLALDHINTKGEFSDLKTDFGYILLIAPKDHSETIMFDEIKNKYNPRRGSKKQTDKPVKDQGVLKNDEEDIIK